MRMPVRELSSGHAQDLALQPSDDYGSRLHGNACICEGALQHECCARCIRDRSAHAQPCVHKTAPSARMYVHASLFYTHHPACVHFTEHTCVHLL